MKRFILISIICASVFAFIIAKDRTSIGNNIHLRTQINKLDVFVSSEEINVENKYIKVNIKYPVIQEVSDKSIQNRLNEKFKKDVLYFKSEIEKQAVEAYNYSKNKGFPFMTYEVFIDFKVTFNKNNILSIPASYYSYTGGAHGFTIIRPYNINLTSGKEIKLKDIFKEGTDYKTIIKNEIIRQMKENPNEYFPEALNKIKSISDDQNFYLEDGNIIIYYGLYDIAPYASGIKEFKIPFSMFNAAVKPEFNY